jgi:membrane protein YdbS with pleckstrin-like domain
MSRKEIWFRVITSWVFYLILADFAWAAGGWILWLLTILLFLFVAPKFDWGLFTWDYEETNVDESD